MSKLRHPVQVETAFASYTLNEILGEGGAGRVYGATGPDGPVAIKVLSPNAVSTDKRRRFKNEINFLSRNKHPNIVAVSDYGLAQTPTITGPFYVMRRYDSSLRDVMKANITPDQRLSLFAKVLDGVEAAHLQGITHRDLKPENILLNKPSNDPVVADFGIADFTGDMLHTLVETQPTQRLANFLYAAPEQRVVGRQVGQPADIYALAMILNELFTDEIPHGTDYRPVAQAYAEFAFIDPVVAKALKQKPADRYGSIAELKMALGSQRAELLSLQRLSQIDKTVIPAGAVDDPLAHEPPAIVGVEWDNGVLLIKLDRSVNEAWVDAMRNMGSYTSAMGIGPETFQFQGNLGRVRTRASEAQDVINYFKGWLPRITAVLKQRLEADARRKEQDLREKLRREREVEEQRLNINRSLRF